MRKSIHNIETTSCAPGVGHYDAGAGEQYLLRKSTTINFDKAEKKSAFDVLSQSNVLGPGHYGNLDTAVSTKSFKVKGGVLSTAKKFEEDKYRGPGVGHYTPNPFACRADCTSVSMGRASISDRGEVRPSGLGHIRIRSTS